MITEPKTPRHTEAAVWRRLHQGALDSGLGRKGLGSLEGCFVGRAGGDLVRNPPFFSLTQCLSWAHCPRGGGHRGAALTGKWLARNFQSCCPNCLTRALSCSSCQNRKDRGLSYTCAENSCS